MRTIQSTIHSTSQAVRDKCKNFRKVDTDIAPTSAVTTFPDGVKKAAEMISIEHGGHVRLHVPNPNDYTKNPKGRFVGTAKLFVAAASQFPVRSTLGYDKPIF